MCAQGPAVWALRAQTDKVEYASVMRRILEATPNLFLREGMAVDIDVGPNDEVPVTLPTHFPHSCISMSSAGSNSSVATSWVYVMHRWCNMMVRQEGALPPLRRPQLVIVTPLEILLAGEGRAHVLRADLSVPCSCPYDRHIHERAHLGGPPEYVFWQVPADSIDSLPMPTLLSKWVSLVLMVVCFVLCIVEALTLSILAKVKSAQQKLPLVWRRRSVCVKAHFWGQVH